MAEQGRATFAGRKDGKWWGPYAEDPENNFTPTPQNIQKGEDILKQCQLTSSLMDLDGMIILSDPAH